MNKSNILLWFRNDLRLHDNPALIHSVKQAKISNSKIYCVYILEHDELSSLKMGSASKWWLFKSLENLEKSILKSANIRGSRILNFYIGKPKDIIPKICLENDIGYVYWNRRYESEKRNIDAEIKVLLNNQNIFVKSSNGSTLIEPWKVLGKQNQRLKVFTPYKNSLITNHKITKPLDKPDKIPAYLINNTTHLEDINFHHHNWMSKFEKIWRAGENNALKTIDEFIENKIDNYHLNRNFMFLNGTSKLSPHLHYGETSPRYIWHKVVENDYFSLSEGKKIFLSEIIWREFAINIMLLFPKLDTQNIKKDFDKFEWEKNEENFHKWKFSQTGYPIVDAAMKQLWDIGWMHNRARMIVASFLTKHLLIPWQWGADWFHHTLLDADFASNYASWQWVAGSGADAAPYFRIFNPITQSVKFDKDGEYIKTYLPQLKYLSKNEIHLPERTLLRNQYPKPIVEHKFARSRALRRYKKLRENQL